MDSLAATKASATEAGNISMNTVTLIAGGGGESGRNGFRDEEFDGRRGEIDEDNDRDGGRRGFGAGSGSRDEDEYKGPGYSRRPSRLHNAFGRLSNRGPIRDFFQRGHDFGRINGARGGRRGEGRRQEGSDSQDNRVEGRRQEGSDSGNRRAGSESTGIEQDAAGSQGNGNSQGTDSERTSGGEGSVGTNNGNEGSN